jgi:hypothetical protein
MQVGVDNRNIMVAAASRKESFQEWKTGLSIRSSLMWKTPKDIHTTALRSQNRGGSTPRVNMRRIGKGRRIARITGGSSFGPHWAMLLSSSLSVVFQMPDKYLQKFDLD